MTTVTASQLAVLMLLPLALSAADLVEVEWRFEDDPCGWIVWGTNGAPPAASVGAVVRRAAGGQVGGCLEVNDSRADLNLYAAVGVAVPTRADSTWRLTACLRSERDDQPSASVQVHAEDPGGRHLGCVGRLDMAPGTAWKPVSLLITGLPAGTARLRPCLLPVGASGPAAIGRVWIDEVRLVAETQRDLNLTAILNRGLRDEVAGDGAGGWTDQGENDLRGLRPGPLNVGGVDFLIPDPAAHDGRAVAVFSRNQPGAAIAGEIAVAGPCDHLLLLHAAAWCAGRVGSVAWQYADDTAAESSVDAGRQVADWWGGMAEQAIACTLSGANPVHEPVVIFATALANPRPGLPVRSVGLRAGDGNAVWLVLAVKAATGVNPLDIHTLSGRDRSTWFPFAPRPGLPARPLLDLSGLLDAPAGRLGFVGCKEGHLVRPDGARLRLWGVNIHAGTALYPTHGQAETAAATLARYGVNVVRLHHLEMGLLQEDHRTLVGEDRLERFDYLVKCLVERGIYLVLDGVAGLDDDRQAPAFGLLDGYTNHRLGDYFLPSLKQRSYDYSRAILSRRNLHTGRPLTEEPGVAFVTLRNERPISTSYHPMPAAYRQLLEQSFAVFLRQRHGDQGGLRRAWLEEWMAADDLTGCVRLAAIPRLNFGPDAGFAGPAGAHRQKDTIGFLQHLQEEADADLTRHLRALGLKVPVNGTNLVHTPAELRSQGVNDLISHNSYYDHPGSLGKGLSGMHNKPQALLDLLAGERDLETYVAAARLAGKPMAVTESAIMFPQEWRASYGLATLATASLQDWDAILHYSYLGGTRSRYNWDMAETVQGVVDACLHFNDPATVGLFPAAALAFLRRDVAPARNLVQVVYPAGEESGIGNLAGRGAFPFGYLAHVSRVESTFGTPDQQAVATIGQRAGDLPGVDWGLGDPVLAVRELDDLLKQKGLLARDRGLQERALVSDTGELRHDWGRGVITVDTARSQGVSGFPGPAGIRLHDVQISMPAGGFATVVVSSLDGVPIASSRRLLVTAIGRAENSTMDFSYGEATKAPDGTRVGLYMRVRRPPDDPGMILAEPIKVRIELPGRSASATPLAADLQAAAAPVPLTSTAEGRLLLVLGTAPASIWHVVEVEP